MAFVTTFIGTNSGPNNAYNIDFSVGAAKTNATADVMLVQALFRIVHFEVSQPFAPPPGETGIEITGKLDNQTLRFILNWQRVAKAGGIKVLLDGVFDPFRAQGQLSTIAHVRYTLEVLNNACHNRAKKDGSKAYDDLPSRDDIPAELRNELNLPRRSVARQYAKS